eukprot:TRINITY_DN12346_c1_g1_i1.p1 TRINITY_DN12346_c1_g1~~TRINITY_DN12346_c1_g1_i1.p1  ORF type:complete len:461 (+),score=140.94 TRINITY_DN12346_c1_g1_i1:78-1460(+)
MGAAESAAAQEPQRPPSPPPRASPPAAAKRPQQQGAGGAAEPLPPPQSPQPAEVSRRALVAAALLVMIPVPLLWRQLRRQRSTPPPAERQRLADAVRAHALGAEPEATPAPPPAPRGGGRHPGARYTVAMNAWRRDGCVAALSAQLLQCPRAAEVRVIWNDWKRAPPDALLELGRKAAKAKGWGRFLVDTRYSSGNITNRFELRDLTTDAVFSLDDDEAYSCRLIEAAFDSWLSKPDAMVCFAPRLLLLKGTSELVRPGTPSGYAFQAPFAPEWKSPYGGYFNSCFVTKGGFLHRKYFAAFGAPRWAALRDMVNNGTTAEDMLMSVVHSVENNGAAPLIPYNVPKEDYGMLRCNVWSPSAKGYTQGFHKWWENTLSIRTANHRVRIMDTLGATFRKSIFRVHWNSTEHFVYPRWARTKRPWRQCNREADGVHDVTSGTVTGFLKKLRRNPKIAGRSFCII